MSVAMEGMDRKLENLLDQHRRYRPEERARHDDPEVPRKHNAKFVNIVTDMAPHMDVRIVHIRIIPQHGGEQSDQ